MAGLLPYTVWYENSAGEVLRLDEAPIVVQQAGLFDYQWNLTAYDRARRDGGRAVFARRAVIDKTLVLDVFADTQEAHNAALDRLHDVLDYDMCVLKPGKLYVNGQYIRCFAHTSVKTVDRDWTTYTVVGLTLKAVAPAWVEEREVTVKPSGAWTESSDTRKRYPAAYPYRYAHDGVCRFVNETGSAAPMIIRFFGPCTSPTVLVGGNEYGVTGAIPSGAYAVIDQTDKTVTMVAADGSKTNLFDRRKKSVDNFLPAPSGSMAVSCGGNYICGVTFLTQRSEPRWS